MAYNIIHEAKNGYLYTHISGPESPEAALQFWRDLAKKAQAEQIGRFLIIDEVTGQLSTIEHLEISLFIVKHFIGKKIAYIDPKTETFDNNKFGENVVYNRGVLARVFHTQAEGLEWLLKS